MSTRKCLPYDPLKQLTLIHNHLTSLNSLKNAEDLGGPRKEFFRLMMLNINEKFFKNGLVDDDPSKYFNVGVVMGKDIYFVISMQSFWNKKITDFFP